MGNTAKNSAAVKKPAAKTAGKAAKATQNKESAMSQAAAELIRMAEEGGVEQNYFFTTTFTRYKMQLSILDRLQKEIDDGDLTIVKTYVKGRDNIVTNPAITEYNKTSLAANQTTVTLLRIIKTFASGPVLGGAKAKQEDEEDIDL